jgi:RNA polymerase sigma factor (TIGR02999 family)
MALPSTNRAIARLKRTIFFRLFLYFSQKAKIGPMNNGPGQDVTQILRRWSDGDSDAPARLMPLVYEDLRRRAAEYLRRERPDHTLQATALVHEAYLKLVDQNHASWRDRAHFSSVAAHLMRRILVQHARMHNAGKRGGKWEKLYLDETRELSQERQPDLVALDDALQRFTATYPREGMVVELKFFGGLGANEIAQVLDVSEKTVLRDWNFAKLWLRRDLTENAAHA